MNKESSEDSVSIGTAMELLSTETVAETVVALESLSDMTLFLALGLGVARVEVSDENHDRLVRQSNIIATAANANRKLRFRSSCVLIRSWAALNADSGVSVSPDETTNSNNCFADWNFSAHD